MISRGSVELATGPDSFERPVEGVFPTDRSVRRSHPGSQNRYSSFVDGTLPRFDPTSAADSASETGKERFKYPTTRYLKTLQFGQAFGEMALLMNYERTANAQAITYVELCVLSRKDFQKILTRYPEDRKRVISSMLSSCLINSEINNVYCPLKEMVRTVYASEVVDNSLSKPVEISAELAASLIAEVVSPDMEDRSIKFGVNTQLKELLVDKRDRDKSASQPSQSSGSVSVITAALDPTQQAVPFVTPVSVETSTSGQVSTKLSALASQFHRINESQRVLTDMMVEMRAAINELSFRISVAHPPARHRPSPQKIQRSFSNLQFLGRQAPAKGHGYLLHARSDCFTVAPGRRNSSSRQRSNSSTARVNASASGAHAHGQQQQQLPQPLRKMNSTNLAAVNGAYDPYSLPDPNARKLSHSRRTLAPIQQRTAPLLRRMSSYIGLSAEQASSVAAAATATASPTQYADQLFKRADVPSGSSASSRMASS